MFDSFMGQKNVETDTRVDISPVWSGWSEMTGKNVKTMTKSPPDTEDSLDRSYPTAKNTHAQGIYMCGSGH